MSNTGVKNENFRENTRRDCRFFLLLVIFGSNVDTTKRDEQAKNECVNAMMSNIGTSTTGYADKQAYDAHVKDKCDGFEINGKPIGR